MDGQTFASPVNPPHIRSHDPVAMALDGFLASVERRALRMAELALVHREDAMDTVQDAMIGFLAYRGRPQSEWPVLFFRVLRSRITDRQAGWAMAWAGRRRIGDGGAGPAAGGPATAIATARNGRTRNRSVHAQSDATGRLGGSRPPRVRGVTADAPGLGRTR